MNNELEIQDAVIQIRDKLQKDNIKLWLPPYYQEITGSDSEQLQALSNRYNEGLSIPINVCFTVLKDLQNNALEKLKERSHFKETGLATLKIRISQQSSGTRIVKTEIRLDASGLDLKKDVALKCEIPFERLKLIANGKVIADDQTLEYQQIKTSTVIMVVILHENSDDLQKTSKLMEELERTIRDAKLLANNADDSYMKLEDQHGNTINLPVKERKSLMLAMTLHEKGKVALKTEDYATALVIFLEADKEFCNCNSKLLESVDNYALLNLDIVWCYLCLKSVSQVPEAEERLRKCEENFHKSYGQNMERLLALKGSTGNEAALFMRLHLMQAIVMYHQNKRIDALNLLLKAEEELRVLKVDENCVLALVELGYSVAEARLGLRATFGNVNAASEYINQQRENRTNARKKALEEFLLNTERKKLGLCADGKQYVEPQLLKLLTTMGYSKETARIALQQCNNNVSLSVQHIVDNPDLLELASASSMEFEELMAGPSSRSESSAERKKKEKELEALNRLKNALPMVDDDHLDLTLEQEEIFLQQYKSLLIADK